MNIRHLAVLVFAGFVAWIAIPEPMTGLGMGEAQAQRTQNRFTNRPNLLELLFGGALRQQQQLQNRRPAAKPKVRRRIVGGSRSRSRAAASAPAAQAVQKSETAKTILVVGDFMAGGLEEGLREAYATNPDITFVDKSKGLSGLVRDDVIDWPAVTPGLIEEIKPIALVVLVGMNDRQQMRLPGGRTNKLSDRWKEQYQSRIERLAKSARDRNLPLFWLGLPPVQSSRMNSDYLVFNEFYREKVESVGGSFIDVWDGFTNAQGAYITAGPDINGQIVRLRNSDGINMTRAGKRKLAFFAERVIRREIGLGTENLISALPGDAQAVAIAEPEYDPAKSGRTVVVALDSPAADGGDMLAGGEDGSTDQGQNATSHRLVAKGLPANPREGRIDASWGTPAPAEVPEETVEDAGEAAKAGAAIDTGNAAAEEKPPITPGQQG